MLTIQSSVIQTFFLGNDGPEILPQGETKAGGEPEAHLPFPDTHRRRRTEEESSMG